MSRKHISSIKGIIRFRWQFLRLALTARFCYTKGHASTTTTMITHTMVHPSLGQVLIKQGWKASLPDMRLNKFVRVASAL